MLNNCVNLVWATNHNEKECSLTKNGIASCSVGLISSIGVIGSAFMEFGESQVICAVCGPKLSSLNTTSTSPFSADGGILECDVKFAPFMRSEAFDDVLIEKSLSRAMGDALRPSVRLSLYPKSLFSISCIILKSSDSDLAALVNCGSLALCDASLEVLDIVTANSISNSDQQIKKPSSEVFVATFSCMVSTGLICHSDVKGRLDAFQLLNCAEYCKSSCVQIREKMAMTLRNKLLA